jgi:ABC-type nitrate/sulfonate/bicarbonate transport system substrate-binding protein
LILLGQPRKIARGSGWAAMTASHTPLWVAQEKGFGLLIEPIFFGAGPPAMQALVAGDLDIVVTSAPNVVNPRLGGADTVMILSIIPTFIDHIISAPDMPIPLVSKPCSMICQRKIPRLLPPTRRASSIQVSSKKWSRRGL